MSLATPNETEGEGDSLARARDRLAAVGFIASLIGHRARNRLAALRGGLELIQAGLERNLSPEHRDELLGEFDALAGDFNLGLEMVRTDFGALAAVSAREVVEEAVKFFRPYASRRGIGLTVAYAPGPDRIRADRQLLRLVLLNLLRNAATALEGTLGPLVTLRTADDEGGRLRIEVADNGPGVLPEIYEKLFVEPVSRTGGTGLGLILCRDALAVMQGSVRQVTLKGRRGACFQVSVPRDA